MRNTARYTEKTLDKKSHATDGFSIIPAHYILSGTEKERKLIVYSTTNDKPFSFQVAHQANSRHRRNLNLTVMYKENSLPESVLFDGFGSTNLKSVIFGITVSQHVWNVSLHQCG